MTGLLDRSAGMSSIKRPLVVDLDGSFFKSDSLVEQVVYIFREKPAAVLGMWPALLKGRLSFKQYVSRHGAPVIESLPVNDAVNGVISQAQDEGREIVLATASTEHIASLVSEKWRFFSRIFASSASENLRGRRKAELLVRELGEGKFDYIGNSKVDVPVFEKAHVAYLVTGKGRLARRFRKVGVRPIDSGRGNFSRQLLRLLRPHQWTKNLLVFLPMIASGTFGLELILGEFAAFVALSLVASALYIVNDVLDVHDDRLHTQKKARPIAAGNVTIAQAASVSALLFGLGLAAAGQLGLEALGVLVVYASLNILYSALFKRLFLVDVFALVALYGLRVILGASIAGVSISFWLATFSFLLFLSLALLKRFIELKSLGESSGDRLSGRGYRIIDEASIQISGLSSGLLSVIVLALYLNERFSAASMGLLGPAWIVVPVLSYWVMRVWALAGRGLIDSDPVRFAVKDPITYLLGGLSLWLVLWA